jgi:transcriptional antiterminator RfaH
MPILPEEPSIYPDTLLNGGEDPSSERRWWALHTKPRQEKALARNLFSEQIAFYLPLVKRTRAYRNRHVMTSLSPLFPGYVFVCAPEAECFFGVTIKRIVRTLTVHEPERLRDDLCRIRRLISSNAPLTPERRLVRGNRVRVRHGPLAGLEGTVLARHSKTRLVVNVDFLQQGASIEIDDFMLETVQ